MVFVVSMVFVVPRNTGIYSIKKGVVFKISSRGSVISVVSVVSSVKRTTPFLICFFCESIGANRFAR